MKVLSIAYDRRDARPFDLVASNSQFSVEKFALTNDTLRKLWEMLGKPDEQIAQIEQRLQAWMKEYKACKAIAAIPSVGLMTATAAVATMGDAKLFLRGREFAAWLGLVGARCLHWKSRWTPGPGTPSTVGHRQITSDLRSLPDW